MTTAREVADTLLRELAPLDPLAAEALGTRPESLMPRLAPSDFAARHDATVRALRAVEPSPDPIAVVLRERLSSEIALYEAGFTTSLLAPLATPVHAVREVFDTLPAGDWDAIGAHLRGVPGALRDYAQTLRTAPRVVAARQVLGAAAQCEKWVDPHLDFYANLVSGRPDLTVDAAAASQATHDFATFLRTELLPRAPQDDAVGRELYTVTSRAFLGADVDLDETYDFGWREITALTAEMTDVAHALGADTVEEAAARLDADPARRLGSPGHLVTWLQERVADVVRHVDGRYADLPPQARAPECRLAPTAQGVMYYQPPDAAFTRPGRIWWAPPADGATSTWREVTTVHHEGVPGHHLQIAVAMAEPSLHPWQRTMAHVHGHAEGWAHYAERLADEIGLLRDPGERLGMLYGQRWRAARIVIDMGLHLGFPIPGTSERWTPERGAAVLRELAGCDDTTARFEIDRYLGWPGQALAFRVGARLWQQLRAGAESRPGFDLRTFHMAALRLGPMGLGPLRQLLG
jgi:uncharacterized protein (DUF885 family)